MKPGKIIVLAALIGAASPANANDEDHFIDTMEEGLKVQMLLYKRVSPEVAEQIKPVSFNDEDRKVLACVFSRAQEEDIGELIDLAEERNEELNALILGDTTISLATLEQRPDVMALMQAQADIGTDEDRKTMEAINTECGAMQMMMAKMNQSGVMEAMRSINTD